MIGIRLACRFADHTGLLNRIFAGVIFVVAGDMLYRDAGAWSVEVRAGGYAVS